MSLAMLFMIGQSLTGLPAFVAGTTVIVVSDDLRTVHARGTVEDGRLVFDAPLPAGTAVQLLFYPPSAVATADSALEQAAPSPAASARTSEPGLQSLRVSVDADGQDLVVLEGAGPVSFRGWLRSQRGLDLVLPGR